jgi:cytochrome c oxidase subunit 3
MWLALAGIVMFFAAFTSAYLVMRSRNSWEGFSLPDIFWFSTAVIVASSITMHLSVKNFKDRRMMRYKILITVTALLGLVFLISQGLGFSRLYSQGITLQWNISASLLYIIVGAHMVHVLGGVIALLVIFFRAYRRHVRTYDPVPVEVVATYWHFVDGLWIYLYIFFLWIR